MPPILMIQYRLITASKKSLYGRPVIRYFQTIALGDFRLVVPVSLSSLVLRIAFLLLISLCWARPQVQGQIDLNARSHRQLQELVEFNEVFGQGHTGFCLYDVDYQTFLHGYNADRLFVPASNVKLLTFYLANRLLGHRTPAIFYQEYPDRIEAWGSGYPLTLHPAFTGYDELAPWLLNQRKPLVLNFPPGDESVARYGPGWSWDDYNDSYVYERSAFPLYGNRLFLDLSVTDAEGRQSLLGAPLSIAGAMRQLPAQEARIRRSEFGNDFTVGPEFYESDRFPIERPLHLSPFLLSNELSAAYPALRVSSGQKSYPPASTLNVLEASLPDTVFRRLLQDSDNFLGEQLLLQAAASRYTQPDVEAVIAFAQDTLLPAIGVENIRWVDGSGLSRYNLLTPRHMARVVMALDQEVGRDRLISLLSEGGVSGTLASRFDNKPEAYIWAKTGSLSGVVCVSGLLKTERGKWLAFSFMHNNFVGSNRSYYDEMQKTLSWCYENL